MAHQSLKGAPGWGPTLWFCVRCLKGQPLYCSAANAGIVGTERERETLVMAPPPMHESAVLPCFHGFPPQAFPTTISSLTSPQSISPQSTAALPWDCSTIPKLHLSAIAPSREPMSLSNVCVAAARTVWFSFHLGCHRSAVSLSALNVSPLTHTIAPMWG